MRGATASDPMSRRNGILYPVLIIAGVAVIVFSVLGMIVMNELLPRADSATVGVTLQSPNSGTVRPAEPAAPGDGKTTRTNGSGDR